MIKRGRVGVEGTFYRAITEGGEVSYLIASMYLILEVKIACRQTCAISFN
jgi:hypothetical protein